MSASRTIRRPSVRTPAEDGFTLIETIIAIVILTIAAPPLLMALSATHSERAVTARSIEASWLAADQLERVIRDRHSPTRGYGYLVEANYPDLSALPEAPAFSRAVTITETAPDLTSAGAGAKTVTVSIAWTDPMTGARSFALSTVLTDVAE